MSNLVPVIQIWKHINTWIFNVKALKHGLDGYTLNWWEMLPWSENYEMDLDMGTEWTCTSFVNTLVLIFKNCFKETWETSNNCQF